MRTLWNNLNISYKLSISFTLIFIIAITLTGLFIYGGVPFTSYNGQIEEFEHEFFKNLDLIATGKKDQILHWIDDWRKDIRVFSQMRNIENRTAILHGKFINQTINGPGPESLGYIDIDYTYKTLLDELNALLEISDWYSSITIIDPETGLITISTDKSLIGQKLIDEKYFQDLLKIRSVSITSCKYNCSGECSHIHVGKVIEDDNYYPLGVIILSIDYKILGKRLTENFIGTAQQIETKLINDESFILLPLDHPLPGGQDAEQYSYKLETMPALLSSRGEDGFIESLDYRGVTVLSAYRSIMVNTDWGMGLILSRDSEELYNLIKNQVVTTIIISGLIILFLILMVILLSRGITSPIRNLMKVSEQIMLGNYTLRARVQSHDEIGKLTRSFNNMMINLTESRENLESKVVERTKNLELEIIERKKIEERIRKISYAVEQSPSVVLIYDNNFKIEYVNPVFTKITGYSLEEALGHDPAFLNTGDFHYKKREKLRELVRDGNIKREVFHNKKKNGEEYWVSVSISAIKDTTGEFTNILEVQEDITEEKGLKEQLMHAQKLEAVGTLAGGIAHDFNNILSVILGYSEYLLSKLDKEDKIYPMMEDIREASNRGASLTGQLLAFSRKQTVQMTSLNLNILLKNIKKMLLRLIGEDVKLSLNLEDNLWQVKADHGQMDQIIMNMVINSSHAMPDGGSLIIGTGNIDIKISDPKLKPGIGVGKFVFFSIKDTGCGIDDSKLSRIFDPFFTTKPIGKGTGLGLSVVYGIVEQHEGWIDVKSIAGKGTEFIIYLPVLEKPESVYSETNLQIPNQAGKGERILLVEDDMSLRSFAEKILTENGYIVFSASSVNEVFDLFDIESGIFDIIFSDVMLPDINGVKLVEFLLERNPQVKILLTSGYTDEKSHWDYIENKGYNFLQKPYTMDTLLIKISEVLKKDKDK
ncbi:MAG: PAS domain S-box protein [Spirochaetales bacterium]|nr:PAS domain S-box protein [Spirochaetales bacterium]